ncbi:hypothetical protein [Lentzea aerocolonigenes]|uniref:hypothetical protein n=1 Tax=Lentzea aerocolonigenes TaxID=68170 RepID=UPI0012DD0648|nr:hypothetical protein [Lentzea aerocolonigenes]
MRGTTMRPGPRDGGGLGDAGVSGTAARPDTPSGRFGGAGDIGTTTRPESPSASTTVVAA